MSVIGLAPLLALPDIHDLPGERIDQLAALRWAEEEG